MNLKHEWYTIQLAHNLETSNPTSVYKDYINDVISFKKIHKLSMIAIICYKCRHWYSVLLDSALLNTHVLDTQTMTRDREKVCGAENIGVYICLQL